MARLLPTLTRGLFLGLVRLFYPRRAVAGAERVPARGPLIAVANHPNGLLDPVLLRLGLDRPLAFLAKSTLFGNPLGRMAMAAFDAIPVYRAHEADTARNEETFERCRACLDPARGGFLALFPEGTSHSDSQLKPLKTGAARIALSVEAAHDFRAGLKLLPVGLLYEDKGLFRSGVTLVVGEPFGLADLADAYRADERAAVSEATARLAVALGQVVVTAEQPEVQRALQAVARLTAPPGALPADADARALDMAAAWRRLVALDPEAAEAVAVAFRRYTRLAGELGVTHHRLWADDASPTAMGFAAGLLPLLLLWPLALVGACLGWLPYRLVRPWAVRLAGRHTDLIGTMKLLLGLVVLTAAYAGWATAAGMWAGAPAGLATLVLGPLTGYVALRFGERVARRREVLRALWLRATRVHVARALGEHRQALADQVDAALRRVRSDA